MTCLHAQLCGVQQGPQFVMVEHDSHPAQPHAFCMSAVLEFFVVSEFRVGRRTSEIAQPDEAMMTSERIRERMRHLGGVGDEGQASRAFSLRHS